MKTALALAVALAFVLSGCGGRSTGPRFHLIDRVPVEVDYPVDIGTIGLMEVIMPRYARDERISTLEPDGSVIRHDEDRWADIPERAVTDAVAAGLREALGSTVVVDPWPLELRPALRIETRIDRMIGSLGGDLAFSGQYRIVDSASSKLIDIETFDYAIPVGGETFGALGAAHGRASAQLAAEIAERIATMPPA